MPVLNSLAAMEPELRDWRQDFHRHPELGYEEHRTASVIADKLRAFGFDDVATGIGQTGVVGVLHGRTGAKGEAQAIMLRSDIDALPIQEANEVDYRSTIDGKMHACGHDGHMTMLLGAAKHLAEARNFDGTVYFNFQPAEEGGAGAEAMIRDGLFTRFACRSVYGMHNWPGMPVGSFHTRAGPLLAASDEFQMTIKGRGGHAAQPHLCLDPVPVAAAIIQSLQTIVSRQTNPLEPAVITTTMVKAGDAFNVIPESVEIGGTVRSLSAALHARLHAQIKEIATRIAEAHGMEAEVRQPRACYPVTFNDADETAFCHGIAASLAGEDNAHMDTPPSMGGEDFSFYAREKPCCFMLCGNGDSAGLHHPSYDFDDSAAAWGASYWSMLVEKALPV